MRREESEGGSNDGTVYFQLCCGRAHVMKALEKMVQYIENSFNHENF